MAMSSQCCPLQLYPASSGGLLRSFPTFLISSRSKWGHVSCREHNPRQFISMTSTSPQDKVRPWNTSVRGPWQPPTSDAVCSRISKYALAEDGSVDAVDTLDKPPEVIDIPAKIADAARKSQEPVSEDNKEKRAVVEEEDDHPLWMEDEDPNWPDDDPLGEGLGFQIGNFFEPKIQNVPGDAKDGDEDEDGGKLDLNWDAEQYQWIVREITGSEWEQVALDDPTPLIYFAFERYGSRGSQCWTMLEAIEDTVRRIIDSRKYPVRAVKSDINVEPDLGAALQIKEVPSILFINGGKLVYRLCGMKTADELMAITSHLFYHSVRPDCMEENEHSHSVKKSK